MLVKSIHAHAQFHKRFVNFLSVKGSFSIMGINSAEAAVFGLSCQVEASFAKTLDISFKIGLKPSRIWT